MRFHDTLILPAIFLAFALVASGAYAQDGSPMSGSQDIQMLPPVALNSTTTSTSPCTAVKGNPQFLAWDGSDPISCLNGIQSDLNSDITISPSSSSPTQATALTVNGGINLGYDSRTCATGSSTDAPAGTMRWNINLAPPAFEGCTTTGWQPLFGGESCSAAIIQSALSSWSRAMATGPITYTGGPVLDRVVYSHVLSSGGCGFGGVDGGYSFQCVNGQPNIFSASLPVCNGNPGGTGE